MHPRQSRPSLTAITSIRRTSPGVRFHHSGYSVRKCVRVCLGSRYLATSEIAGFCGYQAGFVPCQVRIATAPWRPRPRRARGSLRSEAKRGEMRPTAGLDARSPAARCRRPRRTQQVDLRRTSTDALSGPGASPPRRQRAGSEVQAALTPVSTTTGRSRLLPRQPAGAKFAKLAASSDRRPAAESASSCAHARAAATLTCWPTIVAATCGSRARSRGRIATRSPRRAPDSGRDRAEPPTCFRAKSASQYRQLPNRVQSVAARRPKGTPPRCPSW